MPHAVVTGSASGLGAAIAARFENQGYDVIGIDIKNADIIADLSTPEGRAAAVEGALTQSGGTIDRMVVAAGLGGHVENGQLVAKVNYFGALAVFDGIKGALQSSDDARVVVIGSNSSQMRIDPNSDIIGQMLDGDEDEAMKTIGDGHGAMIYGSSKHALTRAVRRRCADWGAAGIRVNIIAPGPVETPMLAELKDHPTLVHSLNAIPIPLDRFASISEITDIMEFLMSDTASYMHGSVIFVDGGTDAMIRPDEF